MRNLESGLKALIEVDTPPCVSIYLPLTDRVQLRSELMRLVNEARRDISRAYGESQAERILGQLENTEFLESIGSGLSSQGVCRGVGIFLSPDIAGFVCLTERCSSIVNVSHVFYLWPLWGEMSASVLKWESALGKCRGLFGSYMPVS